MLFLLIIKIVIYYILSLSCSCENAVFKISDDSHDNLLFASTINGNIHLLNRYTGELKWSNKLSPVIKTTTTNGSILIPNPINGKLYIFHHQITGNVFSPLEYSLMEYVTKTPLFLDNLLLTGSKNDQWLSIDIETGEIVHKYQTGNNDNCPQSNYNIQTNRKIFIGICQYNLVVSDPSSRQIIYNVFLNSLTTHIATDLDEYNMRHYVSSDSGLVVTKFKTNDIETGWSATLDSSVTGLYSITSQGILSRVQFTSMSHQTLLYLFLNKSTWNHNQVSLKKAVFFGQAINSWYVLKTFIHQDNKMKTNSRQQLPLITGPVNTTIKNQDFNINNKLVKGFYEIPAEKYLNHQNRVVISNYLLDFDKIQFNTSIISKDNDNSYLYQNSASIKGYSIQIQIIGIFVIATFLMVTYIAYFITKQRFLKSSDHLNQYLSNKENHNSSEIKYRNDDEAIVISNLCYYPKKVLGYGTNGTVVFQGVYLGHEKPVAVKRLVKSERSHYELEILRQSFDCSNLIKCFYITQSREFTFLALELCECTLEEYVSSVKFRETFEMDKISVCRQILVGVHYLHDKGIVHRDLKPRNVLIMKQNKVQLRRYLNNTNNDNNDNDKNNNDNNNKNNNDNNNNNNNFSQYKIIITDFGLSRQSVDYGNSITKTGYGGTSGYMAPELGRDEVTRISMNSDIFSCGILFYYVFTDGQHPFGSDIMSRQHRIHQGNYHLDQNLISDQMLMYFISMMLESSPNKRPSAEEILCGPLFWKSVEKLSFLCDVSDFIEKNDSSLQISLDKRSSHVFPDKWTDNLEKELIENLTVQRSYKTKNLSNLTRALRNKRNHFHELPPDLSKNLFNNNLNGLADYVDKKFPNLYSTLYKWVRSHIDLFPKSIHEYFPPSLVSKSSDLYSSSDNISEEITEPPPNTEFLEWRKAKRKRPNHSKRCRASKNDKKSIL